MPINDKFVFLRRLIDRKGKQDDEHKTREETRRKIREKTMFLLLKKALESIFKDFD